MALILNIETSSLICSVCISKHGKALIEKEDLGINHASLLSVFIQQVFHEAKLELHHLDAVSVSAGPGSYTGLRIGVVTAKGLCFALEKPLIAIDSLQALSAGLEKKYQGSNFLYCPTIDARRDEIYYGVYGNNGEEIMSSRNIILSHSIPFEIPEEKKIVIGGSGVLKTRALWTHRALTFDETLTLSASYMIPLAEKQFNISKFENITAFEPRYIKPAYILAPSTG